MSEWLLSVDPGLRACGCALWFRGELESAALVTNVCGREDTASLAVGAAVSVLAWAHGRAPRDFAFVCEVPQTYGGRAARGDANDLIALATVVGALAATVGHAYLVRPREWKGNAPKEVTAARAREDLERCGKLSQVILPRAASLRHNVWDAIGIGLWYINSVGRGGPTTDVVSP